jgi:predicted secreted protein
MMAAKSSHHSFHKMLIHFIPFFVIAVVIAAHWGGKKYRQHVAHVRHTDCQHILLNELNHGTIVAVPTNSGVVLTLNDNPSTGYQWYMVDSASSILTLMNDGQHTPVAMDLPDGEALVGGGGTMLWRFWVNGVGVETLKLRYRRSWESFDQPYTEYTVTIAATPEVKNKFKSFKLKIC